MTQTLQTLSIISFAVAGVCLVLAVFFWFFFKIPTVVGDLSGKTARKSIAKMRAANEKTGAKAYKGSKTNAERGKLTVSILDAGKSDKKNTTADPNKPETGLLAENKADGLDSEATGMLDEETGRLDEETGFLDSEATGLLIDENKTAPLYTTAGDKRLEMLEEVMFVHTDEVIN